jgi:hypothetical protein
MAMRRRRAASLVGDLPGGPTASNFEPMIQLQLRNCLKPSLLTEVEYRARLGTRQARNLFGGVGPLERGL